MRRNTFTAVKLLAAPLVTPSAYVVRCFSFRHRRSLQKTRFRRENISFQVGSNRHRSTLLCVIYRLGSPQRRKNCLLMPGRCNRVKCRSRRGDCTNWIRFYF